MSLKLHVFPPSPRAFKVLAVAAYLELDYEKCIVDLPKRAHQRPEYARLNPNRRMPTLEDGEFVLWESNAILQYLADKHPGKGLMPADRQERALVTQWQCWDLAHWEPACAPLVLERCMKVLLSIGEPNPAEVATGLERFARVAPILDGQLGKHRFAAGAALTVADFSLGAVLNVSQMAGLPLQEYPNIRRWHEQLTRLPGWRQSMVSPPCNVEIVA